MTAEKRKLSFSFLVLSLPDLHRLTMVAVVAGVSANVMMSQVLHRAAQVLQPHSLPDLHKLTMAAVAAGVSASAQP